MKPWTKIKAGAIQYVLVISVIIMIVLFAFISLVFLQNKFKLKSQRYKQTIQNVYAGFDYLKTQDIPYGTPIELSFSQLTAENTTLMKRPWGFFDVAVVTSESNNEKTEKIALLGKRQNNRKAIYLQENNQPLVVVGTTRIVGDVILPKRGVKPGSIAGVSYYGDKPVYGWIDKSASNLPRIQNIDYVRRLTQQVSQDNIKYFNFEDNLSLSQSFKQETLLFETPYELSLGNVNLAGNIVLVSKTQIRVSSSAKLNNIILIAPKIIIESRFEGSCQLLASKSIEIKDNVRLFYPSVVSVTETSTDEIGDEKIKIAGNSHISGMVIYQDDRNKSNFRTQVFIEEKAVVTGEVYCNKNLEIAGRVEGFVYTNNFIARRSGGQYINHLYNSEIDATIISENYSGLFLGQGEMNVAKWVY